MDERLRARRPERPAPRLGLSRAVGDPASAAPVGAPTADAVPSRGSVAAALGHNLSSISIFPPDQEAADLLADQADAPFPWPADAATERTHEPLPRQGPSTVRGEREGAALAPPVQRAAPPVDAAEEQPEPQAPEQGDDGPAPEAAEGEAALQAWRVAAWPTAFGGSPSVLPARDSGGRSGDPDLAQRIRAAADKGSPLETGVQRRLEAGLGGDLTRVRVHTDGEADALSRGVGAIAFTTGADIFFRQGAYDPASPAGLHLLAHEATHTLQQAAGPVAGTPAPGGVAISDPADPFERAAEAAATSVVAGFAGPAAGAAHAPSGSLPAGTAAPVQRQAAEAAAPDAAPASEADADALAVRGLGQDFPTIGVYPSGQAAAAPLTDQPGDPLGWEEDQAPADHKGDQRLSPKMTSGATLAAGPATAGTLPAARLQRAESQSRTHLPTVQRFQVEGPWDINDPVHETLTQQSLRAAGMIGSGTRYSDPTAWEYTRGAMWNDDPGSELFDHHRNDDHNYSSGLVWYQQFSSAGHEAMRRAREHRPGFGPGDPLLARSHYGDLQFIHGMASRDGELPQVTQDHMLVWAEFTYKVATGVIPPTTVLGRVPVTGIPDLFPRDGAVTVSALFGVLPGDRVGDVPQRAAGSLLHMIQDSYAGGHTQREVRPGNRRGRITSFHSYIGQSHDLHGAQDAWGHGRTEDERINNSLGARDAVEQGTVILRLVHDRAPWGTARDYLLQHVLQMVNAPQAAGPGAEFVSLPRLTPSETLPHPAPVRHFH